MTVTVLTYLLKQPTKKLHPTLNIQKIVPRKINRRGSKIQETNIFEATSETTAKMQISSIKSN